MVLQPHEIATRCHSLLALLPLLAYSFHMRTQADGEAIRRLREEKGLTLLDLSRISGISHAHLCRLENEDRLGSTTMRTRLAQALGVGISEISRPVQISSRQAA